MIRDPKPITASRRDHSPSKKKENYNPGVYKRYAACDLGINSATLKDQSLVSFGSFDQNTVDTMGFLPSPSFDDLQSSILSTPNELDVAHVKNSSTITQQNSASEKKFAELECTIGSDMKNTVATQASMGTKPVNEETKTLLQSTKIRQSGVHSMAPMVPGVSDPLSTNFTTCSRHQSLHPFAPGTVIINAEKSPKKPSVNNTIDLDSFKSKRRPISTIASTSGDIASYTSRKKSDINIDLDLITEGVDKPKSLKLQSSNGQNLQIVESSDYQRSSFISGKSHARSNERGPATPSSSRKRMSVVPGMPSQSHPSGLGARTVSPTDARRAKRMSTLQGAPPVPNTPPTPQSDSTINRGPSQSPSNQPIKVPTPSSSCTSPDPNRKPHSSRLSPILIHGCNNVTESTGSLPQRSIQSNSSRATTNKTRNLYGTTGNEDENKECVPPVPAIPKAYESPKEIPTETTRFSQRKSSLPFDSCITNNTPSKSFCEKSSRDSSKTFSEPKLQNMEYSNFQIEDDINNTHVKTLEPLRLPPFNLRPLSTTTTDKVEARVDSRKTGDHASNLDSQSSPITASKSNIFGNKSDGGKLIRSPSHSRSSSAIHFLRSGPLMNMSLPPKSTVPNREVRYSGFPSVSSSLPKNNMDFGCMPRTKMNDDLNTSEGMTDQQRPPRLTGPRALNLNHRASIKEAPPVPQASCEEPSTPLSASSLRRKLSLSWRRSASKSSINFSQAAVERDSAQRPPPKKRDNISPSRVPASTTVNNSNSENLPSPSLSVKSTTYLDFKRRKSSTSSLSMFGGYHDRTISESWGAQNSLGKSSKLKHDRTIPTTRTSSMMHRMLNSKDLTDSAQLTDQWVADLDKDDLTAEDEIKKLASKRKDTEHAARHLDSLRKRATPKERMSPQEAIRNVNLNIFERGEIMDYKDIYFCGTHDAMKHIGELSADNVNFGYDDERGDYSIVTGDHLSYRYEVVDLLGKGSFGQVVRCVDHKTGGLVAVKIIRNKKRFHQQALVEVNILQKLREWDPKGQYSMVKFTQSFYFRGHLCISAELLDMNLYELIKSNSFRGFSLKIVRRFTKQILNSLLLLQQHKVIHCDLKPENVLLAHPLHSEIKVIDFGSSCFENEKVYTYIQSRFYRSPEVILGMTYGMPIDMWSLGCIMAELYSGVPIFPGENEQEQLACIMELFGPPEKHLIEKSTRRKLFFDSLGKPRLTVSSKGRRRRPSSKTLHQVLKCDDHAFLDFLSKCLKWDPERRLKPDEAIRHDFITGQKNQQPYSSRYTSSNRNESPIKRNNTITIAPGIRPLPELPLNTQKTDGSNKYQDTSSMKGSPTKTSAGVGSITRRQSTVNGNAPPHLSKRPSHGPTSGGGSGGSALPRVTRNTSGKANALNGGSINGQKNTGHTKLAAGSSNGATSARRFQ